MRKVVFDKKIQGGKPTLQGTRVTIESILLYLSEGASIEELSSRYKNSGILISSSDISEALIFASKEVRSKNE